MGQGLAEPAQDHALQPGKGIRLRQELAKGLHLHVRLGIFPDIADAGAAVEVADGGRFDVELVQIGQTRDQEQGPIPLIKPVLCPSRQTAPPQKISRAD